MPTILVVERDTNQRTIICSYAQGMGINALNAATCQQALDILNSLPVDLVIAREGMCDSAGINLVKRIRNNMRLRHVPIILVTDGETPSATNVNEILKAPVMRRQLVNAVQMSLEGILQ